MIQRLGFWSISLPVRERIWIHAASVGEVTAASPLIESLQQTRPGSEVVISTMTAGARDLARQLIPGVQVYLVPLELSPCIHKMLSRLRPDILVLVELEWWPNLLLACHSRSIPVVVVNGRVTRKGVRRLGWLGPLASWMARCPQRVCARSEVDAERFLQLGTAPERIQVAGDIKLDSLRGPDPQQRRIDLERQKGYLTGQFRWTAGCTHPGEEEQVLEAHAQLLEKFPHGQLMLAPRHVERAAAVLELVKRTGLSGALESDRGATRASVIVIDQLGKLDDAYRISDGAFVGGSLVERGGHNLLEPVAAGCLTCHGPSMSNFADMKALLAGQAWVQEIEDGAQLAQLVSRWAAQSGTKTGHRQGAQELVGRLGGATGRCSEMLSEVLS
ncbi:MAG: 3-deoxy-D-manno-octulosonic acid transferase [Planctomycetota bacterium]|nr:3-deoxy-D-manno-octulosonic acid transferase [Planctomycetota bacterium]